MNEARTIMARYLSEYATHVPGQFCPSACFREHFTGWTDLTYGPDSSNWFSQKRRLFRVLQDVSGAPFGYWQPNHLAITLGIGNLQLPGSYQACQSKLIAESDAPGLAEHWLMPTDYHE